MLWAMRLGCSALLLALLACDGGDGSRDLAVDLPGHEGLHFPDLGGETSARDVVAADATDTGAADADGAGDAVADVTPVVDLEPDGPPPPPCSLFSQFSCTASPSSSIRCEATCSGGGASYQITCSSLVALCGCSKNGSPLGSCSQTGKGCTACENVFSCCQKLF
jgi:hypothetical protein